MKHVCYYDFVAIHSIDTKKGISSGCALLLNENFADIKIVIESENWNEKHSIRM